MGITSKERKIYDWFTSGKTRLFRPISRPLAWLGVMPNTVTYVGVLAMTAFIYYAPTKLTWAAIILLFAILCDALDGCLARELKIDSDKGKFIDVLVDNFNYTLFVIGLLHAHLVNGTIGAILVYFMVIAKILAIIQKNLGHKSDWLIKPIVGSFANIFVYLYYLFFIIYAYTGWDILTLFGIISIAGLLLQSFIEYGIISNGDLHQSSNQ